MFSNIVPKIDQAVSPDWTSIPRNQAYYELWQSGDLILAEIVGDIMNSEIREILGEEDGW